MVFEEKQIVLIDGKPKRKIYVYEDESKPGDPIEGRTEDLTPEEITEWEQSRLPESLEVDLLEVLVDNFFDKRLKFKQILKQDVILNIMLSKGKVTLNAARIDKFIEYLTEERDNPDSVLDEEIVAGCISLLQGLKTKVRP